MPYFVGNFTFKQYIDVTAFQWLNVGLPMITLYDDGQSTTKKSSCINCKGCDPTVNVSVIIPLRYIQPPLKLMRGDSNRCDLLGSTFNRWKIERQMMSTELSLSMRIQLELNPSIMSMMTKGSSYG